MHSTAPGLAACTKVTKRSFAETMRPYPTSFAEDVAVDAEDRRDRRCQTATRFWGKFPDILLPVWRVRLTGRPDVRFLCYFVVVLLECFLAKDRGASGGGCGYRGVDRDAGAGRG